MYTYSFRVYAGGKSSGGGSGLGLLLVPKCPLPSCRDDEKPGVPMCGGGAHVDAKTTVVAIGVRHQF